MGRKRNCPDAETRKHWQLRMLIMCIVDEIHYMCLNAVSALMRPANATQSTSVESVRIGSRSSSGNGRRFALELLSSDRHKKCGLGANTRG